MSQSNKQLPTSVAKVSYWHIPNGTDYENARGVIVYLDDMEEAKALEERYRNLPEMATLMELPKLRCRHCKCEVDKRGEQWWNLKTSIWPQYCWIDQQRGSQFHEV